MAVVIFRLDEDEVDEVDRKMFGIKAVDEDFRYRIFLGYEGDWLLMIFARSEDEAHRRAAWIWDKVFNKEKWYVVRR